MEVEHAPRTHKMLNEYTNVDNLDETSDLQGCLQRYNPRNNPEEFWLLVAIGSMSIGLPFIFIGFIIPRDYVFDSSLPARQMEAIEIYYANLSNTLDMCIVIGMGFVAFGGLIVSCVVMYSVIRGSIDEEFSVSDKGPIIAPGREMALYGSTSTEWIKDNCTKIYRNEPDKHKRYEAQPFLQGLLMCSARLISTCIIIHIL